MQWLRKGPALLWKALEKFYGDGCPSMAASLSFYTFFSLPALLALLLVLLGEITDPERIQQAITDQIGRLIGGAGAEQVQTIIQNAQGSAARTSLAALLGGLALLFGATTAFAQLQEALNKAWGVKPDPRRGQVRTFVAKRIFSFGVVLTVGFLLLVSLSVSATLTSVGAQARALLSLPPIVLGIADVLLSVVVITGLFAVMFRYLPDARIAWRDVRVGAIGTAILFVGGKWAIGLYLGGSDPGTVYGAAGSLAVILIWVYYTSMIVLYGAELTRVWADLYGGGVQPQKGAIAFVEEERPVARG